MQPLPVTPFFKQPSAHIPSTAILEALVPKHTADQKKGGSDLYKCFHRRKGTNPR
jgi:hypothetical protein